MKAAAGRSRPGAKAPLLPEIVSPVRTSVRRRVGARRAGPGEGRPRDRASQALAEPRRQTRFSARCLAAAALLAVGAAGAPPCADSEPPAEIGESQSGNYLAALVAGADRDTTAAAIYFREALRADPRNPDLVERAFAAALADGDVADGFSLADRLIARDPDNSLARLTLAVRAIAEGQFAAARAQLAAGEAGKAHDVTTTLLTAWSYAGAAICAARSTRSTACATPSVAVFRDYHAGLIADLLGNALEAQRR